MHARRSQTGSTSATSPTSSMPPPPDGYRTPQRRIRPPRTSYVYDIQDSSSPEASPSSRSIRNSLRDVSNTVITSTQSPRRLHSRRLNMSCDIDSPSTTTDSESDLISSSRRSQDWSIISTDDDESEFINQRSVNINIDEIASSDSEKEDENEPHATRIATDDEKVQVITREIKDLFVWKCPCTASRSDPDSKPIIHPVDCPMAQAYRP